MAYLMCKAYHDTAIGIFELFVGNDMFFVGIPPIASAFAARAVVADPQ
jgi:hypothetical protein